MERIPKTPEKQAILNTIDKKDTRTQQRFVEIQRTDLDKSQLGSSGVSHADINDLFIEKLTEQLIEKLVAAKEGLRNCPFSKQKKYTEIIGECKNALEAANREPQYIRYRDAPERLETPADRLLEMQDRNPTLFELLRETKEAISKELPKDKIIASQIKDFNPTRANLMGLVLQELMRNIDFFSGGQKYECALKPDQIHLQQASSSQECGILCTLMVLSDRDKKWLRLDKVEEVLETYVKVTQLMLSHEHPSSTISKLEAEKFLEKNGTYALAHQLVLRALNHTVDYQCYFDLTPAELKKHSSVGDSLITYVSKATENDPNCIGHFIVIDGLRQIKGEDYVNMRNPTWDRPLSIPWNAFIKDWKFDGCAVVPVYSETPREKNKLSLEHLVKSTSLKVWQEAEERTSGLDSQNRENLSPDAMRKLDRKDYFYKIAENILSDSTIDNDTMNMLMQGPLS